MATRKEGSSSSSIREGTAKSNVSDQISQAIQSTSNLLQLMQQSSPSQAQLAKLPKNLIAKSDTIRNTGQVLQQLPVVISSLDAYMDHGLHSFSHLNTVSQLLENMENTQLKSPSQSDLSQERATLEQPRPSLCNKVVEQFALRISNVLSTGELGISD